MPDVTDQEAGMYYVKATLWKPTTDTDGTPSNEVRIDEGYYGHSSPIDCVNALLYEIRGKKSDWELAYVDDIRPVKGDDSVE